MLLSFAPTGGFGSTRKLTLYAPEVVAAAVSVFGVLSGAGVLSEQPARAREATARSAKREVMNGLSMRISPFVWNYRALIWACVVARSSFPRRASMPTFQPPAMMIWMGPVYSDPVHFSSAPFF